MTNRESALLLFCALVLGTMLATNCDSQRSLRACLVAAPRGR